MRRRLATVLSAAMLALAVILPAGPALAAPDVVVLAVEGGEPQGPEPRLADDPENEFAPDEYEANFTATLFGRALFALILGLTVLIGIGYWVRVGRFDRAERQS